MSNIRNTLALLSAFLLMFLYQDHNQSLNVFSGCSNQGIFEIIANQVNHVKFDHTQFRLYGPDNAVELANKLVD